MISLKLPNLIFQWSEIVLSLRYPQKSENCYIYQIVFLKAKFNPLTAKLFNWSCVSLTRSTTSSEWKLSRFDKMEVNCFQNFWLMAAVVKGLMF